MRSLRLRKALRLALVLSAAFYLGCNYRVDKTQGKDTPQPRSLSPADVLDFATVNDRVFSRYCTACHVSSGKFDTSNFQLVQQNIQAIEERVVERTRPMPPNGSLAKADLDLLTSWIQAGAPQFKTERPTTPTPGPTATPEPVTRVPSFVQLTKVLLRDKCFRCHDGTNPLDREDDLQTYDLFFAKRSEVRARLILPLTDDHHMPLNESPARPEKQLTKDEYDLLLLWIDSGAPESGST